MSAPAPARAPFWRRKRLEEMTPEEWESLCDGCGRCCLHKLLYEDTGELVYTNVACRLFDDATCRCRDYARRKEKIPDCTVLTPANLDEIPWLPKTCAYRLLAEGEDLRWWHPLVSGDPETVVEAGISVRGRTLDEDAVDDIADHLADWLE